MPWRTLFLLLFAAAGCNRPSAKSVFIDPALETMVPPDTTFAMGANLDAIRKTHVFEKYLSEFPLPQLDDFTKKTGIDPRKSLWNVLSCSNGKTGLFMARGKFSNGDEEPRIQIDGVTRMSYKGYNLFGNDQSAVLFLTTSTAVAGRTSELQLLVDKRNDGAHGFPLALKARISAISADHQVWAAFVGGLQSLNLGIAPDSNAGQVLAAVRGIDSGTLALDVRNGVGLNVQLECRTPQDAKHVHDAIKGIVGIGRLSTPNDQMELLKLYDAIQVKLDRAHVQVTAQVPTDLEDKFLDLWLKKR